MLQIHSLIKWDWPQVENKAMVDAKQITLWHMDFNIIKDELQQLKVDDKFLQTHFKAIG